MTLRPGASEVFRIITPCELADGKRHVVSLRLRADNRVTFEGTCDWRTAQAVEKLGDLLTCRRMIEALKVSIRGTARGLAIERCGSCNMLVIAFGDGRCPDCARRGLHDVPLWSRILRDGRVP